MARPGFWTWSRAAPRRTYKTRLSQHDQDWRGRVEVVAMGRLHRVPRAPLERSSPRPGRSWTPTRVVALTCGKLDQCRRRVQRVITGRRGRAGDRLYRARRTLRTGAGLLTDAQAERLEALFADDRHAAVQAAWGACSMVCVSPSVGRTDTDDCY